MFWKFFLFLENNYFWSDEIRPKRVSKTACKSICDPHFLSELPEPFSLFPCKNKHSLNFFRIDFIWRHFSFISKRITVQWRNKKNERKSFKTIQKITPTLSGGTRESIFRMNILRLTSLKISQALTFISSFN